MSDALAGAVTWLIILGVLAIPIIIGAVMWLDKKSKQDEHRRRYEETRVKPIQRR